MVDPHTIKIVNEGRTVTAERILVATGGHPFVPEMPGKELAITSNEAFHLEELPRKIVIVGGGYIAIEFAGIFHGLGVEVELLYRGGEILRGFDHDLRERLTEIMRAQGVVITCNTEPVAIEKTREGLSVVTNHDARDRLRCGHVRHRTPPEHGWARPAKARGEMRLERAHHGERPAIKAPCRAFTPWATSPTA